ncbi:MAG: SUMF1/EgtB/PvdO family nonheme iron enzyme [Spirochaetales bacterium]|nr:SUMF1/EgtB/PvdO family nonheme iron enzyme [Spirochaetales bacterium]
MNYKKYIILAIIIFSFLGCYRSYENKMVFVEGGSFPLDCGSEIKEIIVNDFYISKYEFTQRDCKRLFGVYGVAPRFRKFSKKYPLFDIRFLDAIVTCNFLSKKEGFEEVYSFEDRGLRVVCDFNKNGYRLPTEAEWIYASRGGQKSQGYIYAGSDDPDEVGWFVEKLDGREISTFFKRVGLKKPNELGLFDMTGNVAELIWDSSRNLERISTINPTGSFDRSRTNLKGGSVRVEPCNDITREGGPSFFCSLSYAGIRVVRSGSKDSDVEPPLNVTEIDYFIEGSNIHITWKDSVSPDFNHVEIFKEGLYNFPIKIDRQIEFSVMDVPNSGSFYIRSVDNYGNKSEYEKLVTGAASIDTKDEMIKISGGRFTIKEKKAYKGKFGINRIEEDYFLDLDNFYIGKNSVTQEEFYRLMKFNPSGEDTNYGYSYPVTMIDFYDAIEYCNRLSEEENLEKVYIYSDGGKYSSELFWNYRIFVDLSANGYRLPTSAEWLYASNNQASFLELSEFDSYKLKEDSSYITKSGIINMRDIFNELTFEVSNIQYDWEIINYNFREMSDFKEIKPFWTKSYSRTSVYLGDYYENVGFRLARRCE